jgi:transcriptional regulator with XRE-family HTH domain
MNPTLPVSAEFSMAAVYSATKAEPTNDQAQDSPSEPTLHRIAQVRRQQGMSLRTVAKRLGTNIGHLRAQEQSNDLKLSDLQRWHEALEVPLSELVEEPGLELSSCVQQRARLVRIMKTAAAIKEADELRSIGTLTQTLIDELVAIMPELKDVAAWHSVGQRRGLDEFGRIMSQTYSPVAIAQ